MTAISLKIGALTRLPGRAIGQMMQPVRHLSRAAVDAIVAAILMGFAGVALFGFIYSDMYLCLEAIFLAFIPYIIWSAYRRVGSIDVFAPDVGFPLAYIVYLFAGSIALPIQTQFGLVLPWIVWLYYIIGLVAYLAGVRLIRKPSPWLAAHGARKFFWPEGRFVAATLILLLIGLLARGAIVMKSGLEILHASNEAARVVGSRGDLAVLALCLEAAFECLLIYLLIKKPTKTVRFITIACMLLILLNAVATTNRNALLRIVLAAFVIFHYSSRRFRFTGVVVIGILAVIFTSVLGTFRDVSDWGAQHITQLERQGFTPQTYWLMNGYEAARLPTETFYMTIQQVPQLDSYTYGTTSFAALSALLPGHGPTPSEIIKDKLRLQFVGFGAAATILAPMWVDGGLIGIIVGMFFFGLLSRALHQRMLRSSNYVWVLVYGWFVQNAFKAIKDDIFPELGFVFMIALFIWVSLVSGPPRAVQGHIE